MSRLIYLIAALTVAATGNASATTTTAPTSTASLIHQKAFSFLFGSSDRDDLEVDVNANVPGDDNSDDQSEVDVLVAGPGIKQFDDMPADSTDDNFNTLLVDSVPLSEVTPSNVQLVATGLPKGSNGADTADTVHDVQQNSIKQDDVVWVTVYSDASVTLSLPGPSTETVNVTQQQTITQVDVFTATVTIPAGSTPSQDAFHQGYDQGYSDGQSQCAPTATGEAGQQAYDEGYVDGAHWGYGVGYNDGVERGPFVLPEFATAAPVATSTPVSTPSESLYTQQPVTYPYIYGGYVPYDGYPPYDGYVPYGEGYSQPQPAPAPPQVSYTTISYYVPYGEQPYGYYPYEQADAVEVPEAVATIPPQATAVQEVS